MEEGFEVVVYNDNSKVYFKVNNTTTLIYLWQAYCAREGRKVVFCHNGIPIKREDYNKTLANLGFTTLHEYKFPVTSHQKF